MIADIIFKNARILDDRIALVEKREQLTYAELKKRIQTLAAYLVSKGYGKNDRILVWQNNSIGQIVSFFAVNLIGAVCVFVDTKWKQEINAVVDDNRVKVILTTEAQAEQLKWQKEIEVVKLDKLSMKDVSQVSLLNYLERMDGDVTDLSTILYTSGSTGNPKGVLNTHENLEEALHNYSDTMQFSQEDIFIGVAPFFHSYAFDSCMLVALYSGARLILFEHFIPTKVLRAVEEQKATVLHAVPFMYSLMNEQLKQGTFDVSSLNTIVSAGSKLDESILREFYRLTGKVIHQEYGSTETGTIAINLSNDVEKAVKYAGKALCHVKLKFVPYEEEHLLTVVSKGMAIGYLDEEPFDRNGYETQDLCELQDGYIWIKGRADRLINITGLKVNPVEVESCLKMHPDIKDVFVKGTKSDYFGTAVEAVIVKKRESLTKEEVKEYCKEHLAAFKVPTVITWEKELVKSGLGKARYQ